MENNNVSEKPIYKAGAFEWIDKETTRCIICSTPEKPKFLKTIKCSISTLETHIKKHPVQHARYQELQAQAQGQPITRYLAQPLGALTTLDRKVINLIATAHLPFNVVDNPSFRALFSACSKTGEVLKGEKHYREFVLPKAYKIRNDVIDWISECLEQPEVEGPEVADITRSPPPKKKLSFLESMRAKFMGSSVTRTAGTSTQPVNRRLDYQSELLLYLGEDAIEWTVDPLDYWRTNAHRFPLLAPVARRFLGAPATSVASEQTFSVAKAVFDPTRCRLDPRKAEMLVFLNRNLPLFTYKY